MGMFHLEMTILRQLYKIHFGKEKDLWSLHMWMDELGQDYRKMWDDSQKGQVKNFHASRDVFFMVLKGYVFRVGIRPSVTRHRPNRRTRFFDLVSSRLGLKSARKIPVRFRVRGLRRTRRIDLELLKFPSRELPLLCNKTQHSCDNPMVFE